jgi:hypothetical protein
VGLTPLEVEKHSKYKCFTSSLFKSKKFYSARCDRNCCFLHLKKIEKILEVRKGGKHKEIHHGQSFRSSPTLAYSLIRILKRRRKKISTAGLCMERAISLSLLFHISQPTFEKFIMEQLKQLLKADLPRSIADRDQQIDRSFRSISFC